jgi:hypothetical protein
LPERQAHAHVARLRAGAGEHQVAKAAEPATSRPAAQRHGQAGEFGEAAGDQGGVGRAAQAAALDDAAGDGQHVLHRPAGLGADHVAGEVGPEGRRGDGLGQVLGAAVGGQARVTAVGRPRATSPAKLGPERTAGLACGTVSASTSVISFSEPCSTPLEQSRIGRPSRTCGAKAASAERVCWAGRRQAPGRCRPGSELAGGADHRVERQAGRKTLFSWRVLIASTTSALAGPERDLAAGPGADLGQRRAPGAAADDAAFAAAHAFAPLRPALWVGAPRGGLVQRPARAGHGVQAVGEPERQPLGAGQRDHGGVVGAVGERRGGEAEAARRRGRLQRRADRAVGRDAAGDDEAQAAPPCASA